MKYDFLQSRYAVLKSPSPRRAWIEIPSKVFKQIGAFTVALPTEGVD